MTAAAYVRLVEARRAMIESVDARTWEFDALVWPTVPTIAPTIASLADPHAYRTANARMLRNPSVVNLLDGCAFSIPCSGADAPVGLSLSAGRGMDDRLIAVAARIESILKGADHASHQGT
jgi:aspartyl-tRNA(Asn)/glutamyl-tRNA(Gln) amidotransferase subunit A